MNDEQIWELNKARHNRDRENLQNSRFADKKSSKPRFRVERAQSREQKRRLDQSSKGLDELYKRLHIHLDKNAEDKKIREVFCRLSDLLNRDTSH